MNNFNYLSFNFYHEFKTEIGHLGLLQIILENYIAMFGHEHKCKIELLDLSLKKLLMSSGVSSS